MKHLLSFWPDINRQLGIARHIFLLTDFDGTLAPIVERPELARIPDYTRKLLQALVNQHFLTLGIISGRSLDDLKERVGIQEAIYAGNHGFEIEGSKINFVNPLANEIKPLFRSIYRALNLSLASIKGVLVENKGLSLSVHYRQAGESSCDVKRIIENVVHGSLARGMVKITPGKEVYEVRPAVEWDKGKAIRLLMKRYGRGGRKCGLVPIYLGDDLTDEDAFRMIEKYKGGISVFVGSPGVCSSAQYYLESPEEVTVFLAAMLQSFLKDASQEVLSTNGYRFDHDKLV